MNRSFRIVSNGLVGAVLICLCGCVTRNELWDDLNRAATPESEELQQTQLAVIGQIATPDGHFHVAFQRLVRTGMLQPRGQQRLLLFDRRRQLTRAFRVMSGQPLWCEGARVYLAGFGSFWDIPLDPAITAASGPYAPLGGNVVDFSNGLARPLVTAAKQYGSSGGIEHDPWQEIRTSGSQ